MLRPLKIQYPYAWYHFINRGRCGDTNFSEDKDYVAFVDLLKELVECYHVKISALY